MRHQSIHASGPLIPRRSRHADAGCESSCPRRRNPCQEKPYDRDTNDHAGLCGSRDVKPDYFVGWGTLALINAGLAQAKGRSGLGWFLASLLLGPVATFLIVILDPAAKTA